MCRRRASWCRGKPRRFRYHPRHHTADRLHARDTIHLRMSKACSTDHRWVVSRRHCNNNQMSTHSALRTPRTCSDTVGRLFGTTPLHHPWSGNKPKMSWPSCTAPSCICHLPNICPRCTGCYSHQWDTSPCSSGAAVLPKACTLLRTIDTSRPWLRHENQRWMRHRKLHTFRYYCSHSYLH
jgi:hypothetical protein